MNLRLLALLALQFAAGSAAACRFAQDAQPAQWYEWAVSLFAAEVTSIDPDAQQALDVITVRVVETFKGPQGDVATLHVPRRMWSSCRLERPLTGARVLVALNPNSDTLLVPLVAGYAERLREHRTPAVSEPAPGRSQSPFHY